MVTRRGTSTSRSTAGTTRRTRTTRTSRTTRSARTTRSRPSGTTRSRASGSSRRRPRLSTTLGSAVALALVALFTQASWPVRILIVVLALAGVAGYLVVRARQAGEPDVPAPDGPDPVPDVPPTADKDPQP